jgi:hypothetical protein
MKRKYVTPALGLAAAAAAECDSTAALEQLLKDVNDAMDASMIEVTLLEDDYPEPEN